MTNNDNFIERLLRLAEENPDECLNLISKIIEDDENMEANPLIRFYRATANMNKGVNLFKKKNEWDDEILDIFEQALRDLKAANDIEPKLDIYKNSEEKIDAIGEILEKSRPGKVQELLGKTKLKYFRVGKKSRLSINRKCAEFLIPSDEAMEIFSNVFFSFPIIIRSALVFYMQKDEAKRHYIKVILWEETSSTTPFGEMNKIKGEVDLYEDGTFKSQLSKDKE